MPKEFENGDFTLKMHQMFSVYNMLKEFGNETITNYFGFVVEKNLGRGKKRLS